MSYNIAIVNFKLPGDFDEACKIVNGLADIEVNEIDEIFKRFHEEATKIYPCICDLTDDEVDDGVWCDGPLINNFRVKAPIIGFSFSKVEEAFPVVGSLALNMGLSILDWQAGKVYNP